MWSHRSRHWYAAGGIADHGRNELSLDTADLVDHSRRKVIAGEPGLGFGVGGSRGGGDVGCLLAAWSTLVKNWGRVLTADLRNPSESGRASTDQFPVHVSSPSETATYLLVLWLSALVR